MQAEPLLPIPTDLARHSGGVSPFPALQ
jgi:hypothetical protein